MKQISLFLPILLCALLLCACEKEIEFKGEVKKPVLVLSGYLTPDEKVLVHLSKSRFIMDDQTPHAAVENATVELHVNGALKEKLSHHTEDTGYNPGYYVGSYRPKIGDKIEIRASATGFEAIKARTEIPLAPLFGLADSTLTYTVVDVTSEFGSQPGYTFLRHLQHDKIRLRLMENKDEENFYFIKGEHNMYNMDQERIMTQPQDIVLSKVLKGNVSDTGNPFEDFLKDEDGDSNRQKLKNIFSDAYVNGRELFFDFEYTDKLKTVMKRADGEEEIVSAGEPVTKEYVISLSNMTKDYYQFVASVDKSSNTEENPFVEPVQVRTNVENGLGILGAYTTSRFVFRFEKYSGEE